MQVSLGVAVGVGVPNIERASPRPTAKTRAMVGARAGSKAKAKAMAKARARVKVRACYAIDKGILRLRVVTSVALSFLQILGVGVTVRVIIRGSHRLSLSLNVNLRLRHNASLSVNLSLSLDGSLRIILSSRLGLGILSCR